MVGKGSIPRYRQITPTYVALWIRHGLGLPVQAADEGLVPGDRAQPGEETQAWLLSHPCHSQPQVRVHTEAAKGTPPGTRQPSKTPGEGMAEQAGFRSHDRSLEMVYNLLILDQTRG